MAAIAAFRQGKFGAQIQHFLMCQNCQKQLKMKILIINETILILKSLLKELCT